jgi:hypothetical protein
MAHYADLSPCDYFGGMLRARSLLAVGWLESGYPYATGDPGPEVYSRLTDFRWRLAWQPACACGGHLCRLGSCRHGSFYSHRNIFVPGHDVVYVAPEGIVHYISCHDYLPPPEFCAAVLASPDEGSPEYFAALRASGFQAAGGDPEWLRRHGTMSIAEARGRALVTAVEVFRRLRGRWPQVLDEAIELVDDAGAWHYVPEEREFTLESDPQAFEAFALRYESRLGVWEVAMGPRWF